MTPLQIVIGITMAAAAIALVAWFARYKTGGADRRLQNMLRKAGVTPAIAASQDAEAIMKEVRRRCSRCQNEDVCERWLAGDERGASDFCPNAGVFEALARPADTGG